MDVSSSFEDKKHASVHVSSAISVEQDDMQFHS